jgi:WD40 repeat protein
MAVTPSAVVVRRRVFISYARQDGADAAQNLSHALRAAGCDVWLDTDRIRGGRSWTRDVEAALAGCEVLVAVLSPGSNISETCRAEQIWALDEGKLVIPVLAVGGASVPVHLRSLNWRRYPGQQTELLNDIVAEPAAVTPTLRTLRYDTIPNLPQNHLIREKALDDLRDLVFTGGQGANIAITALAGMGGIGKTVLATALCRDVAVQRAFPDGIAWISTGRQWDGDFVTLMREVARALGDELSGYDNPLSCQNRYRTILREKAALVVVDDVWNPEHLKPLLVDAPRSRFLFTTRDAGIAKSVADRKYSANLLSQSESRALLARWAGKIMDTLPPEADQIIQECGELAAAIAQVGASLRELSPAEWRDTLEALEAADISSIEDRLPLGQQSFFKSLAVSVQSVPEHMQTRYLKLAVLLEDVPAPLVVLKTLWAVNEAEGRRTARYFVDRSLASWEDETDPRSGIRLHDLQLDYLRARFGDAAALQLIHGAVRLSASAIARKPAEYSSQLVGRLLPHRGIKAIAEFVSGISEGAPRPWLRPLWPSLHPPGTGLIRTLVGHSEFVLGVTLTPDGRRAISASRDHTLKVWDLATGRELRCLTGHSSSVYSVAVTPDGKRAVSASKDKTMKVWDIDSGKQLSSLSGHLGSVLGVALTPDGQRAVSTSRDNTLRLWDLATGTELRMLALARHSNSVWGVTVTPDGRQAIFASGDNTLRLWDLAKDRELRTLAGHTDCVYDVAVTPDGRQAVSASRDRTLRVWDLATGQELRVLTGHTDSVNGVAITPDGQLAVSASDDKTLKLWDLALGRELRTLSGHAGFVSGIVVTPDGRRAISSSHDRTLKIWDLVSGRELNAPAHHSLSIHGLAVTAGGRRAVSVSQDGTFKLWDLATGRELRAVDAHSDWVRGVAVTPDGRFVISGSKDTTLKVWALDSGREVCTLAGHSGLVNGLAVTAKGQRVISASRDGTLKIWDIVSGQELRTLAGHSDSVRAVALTVDELCAISGSNDGTLKLWDLNRGLELCTMKGHLGPVTSVAVTSDGMRAVSGSDDETLKVWDLVSGQELKTLIGHSGFVLGVAMTADGRRAASVSSDRTVLVWDLDRGTAITGFSFDSIAVCCSFTGSNEILAGDGAGRLHLLRLEIEPSVDRNSSDSVTPLARFANDEL